MYQLIDVNGHGSTTEFLECLPYKEMMEAMYSAGVKLFIDGKKQTKAQAIELAKSKELVGKNECGFS